MSSGNSKNPLIWSVVYHVTSIDPDDNWPTILVMSGQLPFIPFIGMKIQCGGDGAYRQVSGVNWSSLTSELLVMFVEDVDCELGLMRTCGWREI